MKPEKAEKTSDKVEDDILLCTVIDDIKMVQDEERISFVDDVKFRIPHAAILPIAGRMSTIKRDSFFMFTKHMGIGDLGISCHITNNDMGLYHIINFDKLV